MFAMRPYQHKAILYCCLQGDALALACPTFNPTNPRFTRMSVGEYADALRELFEPAAESEQMQLEFEARYQQPGEHPEMYFRDKLRIFLRAYSANMRNYEFLYDKLITGLINQRMKDSLREFRPDPIHNTEAFRVKMIFLANVQRRRLLAGEITEAEALGAEAHVSSYQFRSPIHPSGSFGQLYPQVKQEPGINSMKGRNHTGNKNGIDKGTCHYCKLQGHYIAQCPRKLSGLAPTIQNSVEDDEDPEQEEDVPLGYEDTGIHLTKTKKRGYSGNHFNVQVRGSGNPGYKPGYSTRGRYLQPNKKSNSPSRIHNKKHNRRMGFLYEDERGHTCFEEYEQHSDVLEDGTEANDEHPERINMLQLENYQDALFSEAACLPSVFLGM